MAEIGPRVRTLCVRAQRTNKPRVQGRSLSRVVKAQRELALARRVHLMFNVEAPSLGTGPARPRVRASAPPGVAGRLRGTYSCQVRLIRQPACLMCAKDSRYTRGFSGNSQYRIRVGELSYLASFMFMSCAKVELLWYGTFAVLPGSLVSSLGSLSLRSVTGLGRQYGCKTEQDLC